eukprot:48609_1
MVSSTKLCWLRATFFFMGSKDAFIIRFLPLIFVAQNLSDSQIGIILSSSYFSVCCVVPLISAIADLKSNRFLLLMIAYIATALVSLLFLLPYYWFNITNNEFIFYWSLIIMICFNIPSNFIMPFLDALCLLVISDNKKQYGKIRTYTAISWGLFHCIIGALLEYELIKLHFNIYLYLIFTTPVLLCAYFSFHKIDCENNQKQMLSNSISLSKEPIDMNVVDNNDDYGSIGTAIANDQKTQLCEYLLTLKFIFSKSETIAIFLIGFSFGGGWYTVQSLLFVYISDLVNNNDEQNEAYLLMGLSVGVSVLFEIPFFYLSEWFVIHLGYRNMILVGFTCYIVRLMGYTILTSSNLWLLLVIETLQGITYGLVHVAVVTVSSMIFPKHLAVTAQGLMASVRYGVAPFIYLFIAGYIMEYLGGQWLYRILAIITFVSLIMFYFLSKNLNNILTENK